MVQQGGLVVVMLVQKGGPVVMVVAKGGGGAHLKCESNRKWMVNSSTDMQICQ